MCRQQFSPHATDSITISRETILQVHQVSKRWTTCASLFTRCLSLSIKQEPRESVPIRQSLHAFKQKGLSANPGLWSSRGSHRIWDSRTFNHGPSSLTRTRDFVPLLWFRNCSFSFKVTHPFFSIRHFFLLLKLNLKLSLLYPKRMFFFIYLSGCGNLLLKFLKHFFFAKSFMSSNSGKRFTF